MAWQTFEFIPSSTPGALVQIKDLLVATGAWEVPSSSDGTTYNPSGDTVSHGGSGAGGLGNTNAWLRIRPRSGGLEFTIQRTVSDTVYRVKLARAEFNAGSPSATQTPATTTATDEQIVLGAGTDAAPTGASYTWAMSTPSAGIIKGAIDTESPYGFWFAASPIGGQASGLTAILLLDPLLHTIAGDAFAYVFRATTSTFNDSAMSADSPSGQVTWLASATPTTPIAIPACGLRLASGSTRAIPRDLISTPNGRAREFPLWYGRRSAIANPGYKGVSSLLRWIAPDLRRWTTLSVASNHDRIVYDDVTLPWGGERAVF